MAKYVRLIQFVRPFTRDIFIKILIGLSITAFGFLQAFMLSRVILEVFTDPKVQRLVFYVGMVLLAILLKACLIRYQEGYNKRLGAKIKTNIRKTLLTKLLKLGPAYQNGRRSGNMQSLVTDGVESLETFLVNYVPQTVVVAISVLVGVFFVMVLDLMVGILMILSAFLSVVIPHLFMPAISKMMVGYWQDYAQLNSQYIDVMQGMATLKAFQTSHKKVGELETETRAFAKSSIDNTGLSLADSSVIILLSLLGSSVCVVLAAWHVSQNILAPSALLLILFFTGEIMRPLYDLNTYWHGSYLGFSVAEQIYSVLDEPILVEDVGTGGKVVMSGKPPAISLKNVSFTYPNSYAPALQNVSMDIKSGQVVALVGKSGSGKSTIVNLLERFYDVTEGKIQIDGCDIKDYSIDDLRRHVSVVFQDTYLFYGTIEDNLRMAKPDASQKELEHAAMLANAHSFISALPEGYQTMVGERGSTLSGGERQRIAIARAILKDAPLLILDEATSSVDLHSERWIQEALERLMKDRTTIIIAHRLSTVTQAEVIFVLNEGVLKEQGSCQELIDKNKEFAELIRIRQAEVQ